MSWNQNIVSGYADRESPQAKDNLQVLESSVHYFEKIAEDNGNQERRKKIDRTLEKLKSHYSSIKQEVECEFVELLLVFAPLSYSICATAIDKRLSQLQTEVDSVFQKPELQKYPVGVIHLSYKRATLKGASSTNSELSLPTTGCPDARTYILISKTGREFGGKLSALKLHR